MATRRVVEQEIDLRHLAAYSSSVRRVRGPRRHRRLRRDGDRHDREKSVCESEQRTSHFGLFARVPYAVGRFPYSSRYSSREAAELVKAFEGPRMPGFKDLGLHEAGAFTVNRE